MENDFLSLIHARRPEMLKLEKMVDRGLVPFNEDNLNWASCMDKCFAEVRIVVTALIRDLLIYPRQSPLQSILPLS